MFDDFEMSDADWDAVEADMELNMSNDSEADALAEMWQNEQGYE